MDGDDGKKKRRSGGCGSERFTMWPKFYIFEVAFNFSLKFRYSEEAKTNLPISLTLISNVKKIGQIFSSNFCILLKITKTSTRIFTRLILHLFN